MKRILITLLSLTAFSGISQTVSTDSTAVLAIEVDGVEYPVNISVSGLTGIQSDITGEPTGSSTIPNLVEIDYDDYVAGTPVAGTKYLVNEAPPVEEYTSATAVPLDGSYYGDMSTANTATAYTTDASRRLRGGWAKFWINTTTLPTVDGDSANYDDGATWVSGDDFWLIIWYDGINVKKFLLKKL